MLGISLAVTCALHMQGELMGLRQKTLKNAVTLTGVGLHSGKPMKVTLKPARAGQGLLFVRTDLDRSPLIAAHYKNVINTQLATTLGCGKVTISTVEHVLAALQGAQVDNAIIEVDGVEVPILDGSAAPFFEAIQSVGVVSLNQSRPYLSLRRKVELKLAEKWAVAEPSSCLEIRASVEFDHPSIGYQEFHYTHGETPFSELASARTFGFLREVEALKRMGLARGGSLDNAVVMDDYSVLNPDGLRYADEFVRHKVLDALGDFGLAGIALHTYVRLHRAGHDLHSQLLLAIFSNPDNFEIIDEASREDRAAERVRAALARSLAASVS